jgi:hypothetical protein
MTDTSAGWIPTITEFYDNVFKPTMENQGYPCPELINYIMWYKEIEKHLNQLPVVELSGDADD